MRSHLLRGLRSRTEMVAWGCSMAPALMWEVMEFSNCPLFWGLFWFFFKARCCLDDEIFTWDVWYQCLELRGCSGGSGVGAACWVVLPRSLGTVSSWLFPCGVGKTRQKNCFIFATAVLHGCGGKQGVGAAHQEPAWWPGPTIS